MNKSYRRVEIYGSALQGALNAMNRFGSLGQDILRESGVEKLRKNKLYPASLRAQVFDSLFERYGEASLRAVGFSMAELWQDTVLEMICNEFKFSKMISQKKRNTIAVEHTAKRKKVVISLEQFFERYMKAWDHAIKTYAKTDDISFGANYCKLTEYKYKLNLKSAGIYKRHQILILENMNRTIVRFLAKDWNYRFTVVKKEIKEDVDGCLFVLLIQLKKQTHEQNVDHLISVRRSNIMDNFLSNVLLYSDMQKRKVVDLSTKISKYIPPQIHDALFTGKYDTGITTRRKKLTVFFSDIANFTLTSEGLQPEDLTKYLNEYFSEMTKIALDCGATIDKYIGDAMMVFFGDPESKGEKEDARACVEMALKMQERMKELQEKWSNEGFSDPFQVRMGINTGYCNVGNFGSDQRLTYTIIGGEVNIAQRLESGADANGILISYEAYAHAQGMIEVEQRKTIKMKGISRKINVFAVTGRKSKGKNGKKEIKKKPTKRELSEIERIKKDLTRIDNNLHELNKKMDAVLKKI